VLARHVVEWHVSGFGRYRVPEEALAMIGKSFERRIAHDADAASTSDEYRRFENAAFVHPMRTGHVAVAISCEEAREHSASVSLAARKYGSDAGANRPLPANQRTVAGDQCLESDFYT
jgi:hypothetical protein